MAALKILLVSLVIGLGAAASLQDLETLLQNLMTHNNDKASGACGPMNPKGPQKSPNAVSRSTKLNDGRCGLKYDSSSSKTLLTKLVELLESDKGITKENVNKIIGGAQTKVNEYPWVVSVQDVGKGRGIKLHKCGGSLIHKEWVLSAASCLFPSGLTDSFDTCTIQVEVAEYSLSTWDDYGSTHQILAVVAHPDFDASTGANDLVLLKLKDPVDLNKYGWQNSVCLDVPSGGMPYGEKCTVVGWGATETGGDTPYFLQGAAVTLMKDDQCGGATVAQGQMCAGELGKSLCKKDGGGPLVCETKAGQWNQVGIVSGVDDCSSNGGLTGFGVYTKVPDYIDWIGDVIENN